MTLGNKLKPAFAAFQAPLAQTSRSGTHASLWGQLRAPAASSTARLERKVGVAWRLLATVPASRGGFIRWTGVLPRGAVVRLHAGAITGAPLSIR